MSDWWEMALAIGATLFAWTLAISDLLEHARWVAESTAKLQELELDIMRAQAELSRLPGGQRCLSP
jgi:hypothetical protein